MNRNCSDLNVLFIKERRIVARAQDHRNRQANHSSLRMALISGAHELLQADLCF
jgi:hypothetical protein